MDERKKAKRNTNPEPLVVFYRKRNYIIDGRKLLYVLKRLGYKNNRLKKDTKSLLKEYKLLDDYFLEHIK